MMKSRYTFNQLNDAVTNCTSYYLQQSKDEEGETIYLLIDGCGDQDGDPFYELFDVEDYVCNNDEVHDYLMEVK